jgi:hypothetical protein
MAKSSQELMEQAGPSPSEVDESSREEWLLKLSGWDKGKLEREIKRQQDKFAGLLSRENAIEVLARSLQLPAPKPTPVKFQSIVEVSALPAGTKQVNLLVRAWQIFSPKRFTRATPGGVKEGKVCNITIRDATGTGTLALWDKDAELAEQGKIRRNSILKILSVVVKTPNPLEVSSAFITKILVATDEEYRAETGLDPTTTLPLNLKEPTVIPQLVEGLLDVDVAGRLLNPGKLTEFTRVGKTGAPEKGMVADGLLTDSGKNIRLVAWDENARILSSVQPGEAIEVESGYVKTDSKTGKLELHASWRGRIVRNAPETGLTSALELWESAYKKATRLSQVVEGAVFIADSSITGITSAKTILKCSKCGTRVVEGTHACPECGNPGLKNLILVKAVLKDDLGDKVQAAFFDQQALQLLGLKELTIPIETAVELKRAYLEGSKTTLILAGRKNPADGSTEATVKHVISVTAPKTG